MTDDVQIHGKAGDMAFLFALNAVIDALVSHRPEYELEITNRIVAKINEVRTSPGLEEVAPALEVVLRALRKSGRALQRTPPSGTA